MFMNEVPPLPQYGEVEIVEEEYSYDDIYEYAAEYETDYSDEIREEEDDIMAKPLDTIKVTSAYTGPNKTRTYKYNGKYVTDHHYGIDLIGGTKIYATAAGKVIKVVNKGEKGGTMCLIRIQHKDYQSAYYHIASGSAKVKVGDWVKKGQYIADMGNTGKATGKHLHFQIDKGTNKTAINPTPYAKGNKELEGLYKPTSKWEKGDYKTLKEKYIRKSAEVNSKNKIKYKVLPAETKEKSFQDKLGYARYKIGATVTLTQFTTDKKKNVWGKVNNTWICVQDSTGDQVEKI